MPRTPPPRRVALLKGLRATIRRGWGTSQNISRSVSPSDPGSFKGELPESPRLPQNMPTLLPALSTSSSCGNQHKAASNIKDLLEILYAGQRSPGRIDVYLRAVQ